MLPVGSTGLTERMVRTGSVPEVLDGRLITVRFRWDWVVHAVPSEVTAMLEGAIPGAEEHANIAVAGGAEAEVDHTIRR